MRVCLPPLAEQRTIAAFLDRETTKLDALIAKKERLLALLAEKRAALISHAVTKGLGPSAPMRDSGVTWLGEIPAHWEVKAFGHALLYIGYGFTNPMPVADNGPVHVDSKRHRRWDSQVRNRPKDNRGCVCSTVDR